MSEIDNGLLSSMLFAVNCVMVLECNTVFSRIAESISIKNDIPKSEVINFLCTKISFSCFEQC